MTRTVRVTEHVSVRAESTTGSFYQYGRHEVPDDVAEDLLEHRAVVAGDTDADGSDGADSDDWDATAFVDNHHATVKNQLQAGQADGHLDEVRDAEQARDRGGRDTVLQAISARQEQVQG